MVRINPFDYFKNLNVKQENLIENFSEIKNGLWNLEETTDLIENFEKNSIFHSEFFIKKAKNHDIALKIKILNSELRENKINERLQSLSHNLGLLRMLLAVKDDSVFKKINHSFLTNDYSSIPALIKGLNNFKNKIDKLEQNYKSLINERYASIDFKVRHEHHLEGHLKNLNDIHKKQKKLLVAMGVMFTNLTNSIIKQKNLKGR